MNSILKIFRLRFLEAKKIREIKGGINDYHDSITNDWLKNRPELWRRDFVKILIYTVIYFIASGLILITFIDYSKYLGKKSIDTHFSILFSILLSVNLFVYYIISQAVIKKQISQVHFFFFHILTERKTLFFNFIFGLVFLLQALLLASMPFFIFETKPLNIRGLDDLSAVFSGEFYLLQEQHPELSREDLLITIRDSVQVHLDPNFYKHLNTNQINRLIKPIILTNDSTLIFHLYTKSLNIDKVNTLQQIRIIRNNMTYSDVGNMLNSVASRSKIANQIGY